MVPERHVRKGRVIALLVGHLWTENMQCAHWSAADYYRKKMMIPMTYNESVTMHRRLWSLSTTSMKSEFRLLSPAKSRRHIVAWPQLPGPRRRSPLVPSLERPAGDPDSSHGGVSLTA